VGGVHIYSSDEAQLRRHVDKDPKPFEGITLLTSGANRGVAAVAPAVHDNSGDASSKT